MNINTVIIGAGPAGIAAAIQLKRAGVDFVIVEKGEPGGLLLNANLVENYPGFPAGISGVDLVARFREHMRALDISILKGEVTSAERLDGSFVTRLQCGEEFVSTNLVVSSGTRAKQLEGAGDVRYEVYPLLGISGKNVAVIGAGDAAFDYALNLTQRGNRVTILMRGDRPKALPLLVERAAVAGVEVIAHIGTPAHIVTPAEAGVQKASTGLDSGLRRNDEPRRNDRHFDHIIAAIGREPEAGFLSADLKKSLENGREVPGLYFAGDIKNGRMRYVTTAVADGIRCAEAIGYF
jgi:thioredoxin reductase